MEPALSRRYPTRLRYDNEDLIYDMSYHPIDNHGGHKQRSARNKLDARRQTPINHAICSDVATSWGLAMGNFSNGEHIASKDSATMTVVAVDNEVQYSEKTDRRSTRLQTRLQAKDTRLIYNSKYHPADDVLRPITAAKLRKAQRVRPSGLAGTESAGGFGNGASSAALSMDSNLADLVSLSPMLTL